MHKPMPRSLSFVLPVMLCACAAAAPERATGFPHGSYRIRAAQIDYYPDGTYKIHDASQTFVEGRYEVTGDTIVMTDVGGMYGCTGDARTGRYKWAYQEAAITLSLLEDPCEARRGAMQESPFPALPPQ